MPIIDVHHHFFPDSLKKAQSSANVGWRMPPGHLPWTPEVSLKLMDESGISVAIISMAASAAGSISEENRRAARSINEGLAEMCKKYPKRFGFFATLPFLDDVQGALYTSVRSGIT